MRQIHGVELEFKQVNKYTVLEKTWQLKIRKAKKKSRNH